MDHELCARLFITYAASFAALRSRAMCGLVISAFVLSFLGAVVQRGAAAALGVPARFVLGVGPRWRAVPDVPRAIELRRVMVWAWVPLMEGGERWRRGLVRAVGPLAIAVVPFSVQVGAMMLAGASEDIPSERLVVEWVEPGSAADQAGISAGDVIVSVAGQPVRSDADLRDATEGLGGVATQLELDRNGTRREVVVTPEEGFGGRAFVGVEAERLTRRRPVGLTEAIRWAASIDSDTLVRLGRLVGGDIDGLAGPIGLGRARVRAPDPWESVERVALFAGLWTLHAIPWSIVAAISELVRALRGRAEAVRGRHQRVRRE